MSDSRWMSRKLINRIFILKAVRLFLKFAPLPGELGEAQIQQPFGSRGRGPGTPSALGAGFIHKYL